MEKEAFTMLVQDLFKTIICDTEDVTDVVDFHMFVHTYLLTYWRISSTRHFIVPYY